MMEEEGVQMRMRMRMRSCYCGKGRKEGMNGKRNWEVIEGW